MRGRSAAEDVPTERELSRERIGMHLGAATKRITLLAAFAAAGLLLGFSLTIVAGICVMFAGFVRASRRAPLPQPVQTS